MYARFSLMGSTATTDLFIWATMTVYIPSQYLNLLWLLYYVIITNVSTNIKEDRGREVVQAPHDLLNNVLLPDSGLDYIPGDELVDWRVFNAYDRGYI